jgi:hypothetical protein
MEYIKISSSNLSASRRTYPATPYNVQHHQFPWMTLIAI